MRKQFQMQEQSKSKREELLARNRDLIDKFLELAERKVSLPDEYGDENWDVLPSEIMVCLRKLSAREGIAFHWEQYAKEKRRMLRGAHVGGRQQAKSIRSLVHRNLAHSRCLTCGRIAYQTVTERCAQCGGLCALKTDEDLYMEMFEWLEKELKERFRRYHEEAKSRPSSEIGFPRLSGEGFEADIAKWLRSGGYNVQGTPKTGDQGADLIADRDGKRIVIQAKCHRGSVGNSAVQEVIGALKFYGGDEGWVITNSIFTSSATDLAHRAGIRLFHRWTPQTPHPEDKSSRQR